MLFEKEKQSSVPKVFRPCLSEFTLEQCGVFARPALVTPFTVLAGGIHKDLELLQVVKLKLGSDLCKGRMIVANVCVSTTKSLPVIAGRARSRLSSALLFQGLLPDVQNTGGGVCVCVFCFTAEIGEYLGGDSFIAYTFEVLFLSVTVDEL